MYGQIHEQMRLQKAIADLEAGKGTVHELIAGEDDAQKMY